MRQMLGLVLLLCLMLGPSSRAQDPQPVPFRAQTSAVVVDVVARDAHDRLVTDLKRADFDLLEDGVPQTITTFKFVNGDAANSGAPVEPAVIALVFDRLSIEARRFANRAARVYVDEAHRPEDRVAVFAIDWSLTIVQDYTNDRRLLRDAVDQVTAQHFMASESPRDVTASSPTVRVTASTAVDIFGRFGELERSHVASATTTAMRSIAQSFRDIPGRKAIILLSEGLRLPDAARHHFYDSLDIANSRNVSIYVLDAAGLRTRSPREEMRSELAWRLDSRQRVSESLQDPESALYILARETSGLLVNNTNDLVPGLRRVSDEMHGYYLLTYTPSNQTPDGKFRKIVVKVKRRGVDLWARKGYRAPLAGAATP